ncbi:MAG: zinc ribbon domain-containing protein [Clostridia bacterium]|nr:zinc ribbon domain-containing protein [Clostridia bacterium]
MEFMDRVTKISKIVGKTATDTYNTVADKSGKVFEDAKLKLSIADKETEIEKVYEEMGKTIYDSYKNGEDIGKVFTKEAKKIDKFLAEIDDMNKKILFNKGLRACDSCGEIISNECTFCQSCGKKQKPIKIKVEKKEEVKKEEPKEKVCSQCGLVCDAKAKFCSKCGYSF